MGKNPATSTHEAWALFRFSVVGGLFASPPKKGELREALDLLAATVWEHPITGEPSTFARQTIERWYYRARKERNPVGVLRRKVRKDCGTSTAVGEKLEKKIREQYRQHQTWSYQLHYDNLRVLVEYEPSLGGLPSYSSVRRFFLANGLRKRRKPRKERPGKVQARKRRDQREIRSYEREYVGSLWHLDFHEANHLQVITPKGKWVTPLLLGILDDHARLGCHVQWYFRETAENLAHGLRQAFLKRGIPWEIMSDKGSAMIAREIKEGLERLSILQDLTLEYSPHQNGKQERFWGTAEGRLMAMLEGVENLTLELLNAATQAWLEMEYHRKVHSETQETPLKRFLHGPNVLRPCPSSERIRNAFRIAESRKQRQSDGTISAEGLRFQIPSRFRQLRRVTVHYARWDLSNMHLVDPKTNTLLAPLFPVNKAKNAEGVRKVINPAPTDEVQAPSGGVPPLLRKLMEDYAATGLPPAYLPKTSQEDA